LADEPTDKERIWQVISMIPAGSVATYGQIAKLAELPGRARLVGHILSQLPKNSRLPWFRVVNAAGKSSLPPGSVSYEKQKEKLQEEGVVLLNGRLSLARYQWEAY